MDIERCNSIFELFAAFNFTYAVFSEATQEGAVSNVNENNLGKSYVDVIDNRLLKPLSSYFNEGRGMLSDMSTKSETLKELKKQTDKTKDGDTWDKLNELKGRLEQQKGSTKTWVDEVTKERKSLKNKINEIFPLISFLMALFCISVLGVAISESTYKHFILLLLLIFTGSCYWKIVRGSIIDHYALTKTYLFGIGSMVLIHIGMAILKSFNNLSNWFYFFDLNPVPKQLLILLCLVAPFGHFIVIFFKIGKKYKGMKTQRTAQLDNHREMYNNLKHEIDTLEVKIMPENNKLSPSSQR